MARVACIGWGSLVWNPGELRCVGDWQPDGPALPVEFARTSQDGRLTLVLTDGTTTVPTLWVELDYASVQAARDALRVRERTASRFVGLWPGPVPAHSVGAEAIASWALDRMLDAVVWTALPPKFQGQDGQSPGSADAAVEYLRSLNGEALAKAREYVERAPVQIQTPYRRAFDAQLGWR
jgi:hypothetical protein